MAHFKVHNVRDINERDQKWMLIFHGQNFISRQWKVPALKECLKRELILPGYGILSFAGLENIMPRGISFSSFCSYVRS